ncbi:MAG: DUF4915 domain-containing protein [Candidatus Shapirobacteria bacterium]
MKFLISFCNTKNYSELTKIGYSPLGLFDTNSNKLYWIPLPSNLEVNGITGLCQSPTHIFAIFPGPSPGVISINKSNPNNLKIIFLSNLGDPHSLVYHQNYLYIVSTSSDSIYKHEVYENGTVSATGILFWKPRNSEGNSDTHHLNSILIYNNNLLVSAFGIKTGDRWSSANNGYIYDITNSKYLKKQIYHPHTVTVNKDNIYVCESSSSSILKDHDIHFKLDSGYVRGLIVNKTQTLIGVSSGRLVSKSSGITNNPADLGALQSNCKVIVCKHNKYFFYDFSAFHNEIYDLMETNLKPPSTFKSVTLNKFSANFSTTKKTIYHLNPKPIGWQTYELESNLLDTYPTLKEDILSQNSATFINDLIINIKPKVVVGTGINTFLSLVSSSLSAKSRNFPINITAVNIKNDTPFKLKDLKEHLLKEKIHILSTKFSKIPAKFSNNSIDLLFVDGFNSLSHIKSTFKSWLPKISPNGIIIIQGINETKYDFGAKLFWEDIKLNHPSFSLLQSSGLGVLFLNKQPKVILDTILSSYYSLSTDLLNLYQLNKQVGEKDSLIQNLKTNLFELNSVNNNQNKQIKLLNMAQVKIENQLIKNINKNKLHIKATKNEIKILEFHLKNIRSSKFFILWQTYTKLKKIFT